MGEVGPEKVARDQGHKPQETQSSGARNAPSRKAALRGMSFADGERALAPVQQESRSDDRLSKHAVGDQDARQTNNAAPETEEGLEGGSQADLELAELDESGPSNRRFTEIEQRAFKGDLLRVIDAKNSVLQNAGHYVIALEQCATKASHLERGRSEVTQALDAADRAERLKALTDALMGLPDLVGLLDSARTIQKAIKGVTSARQDLGTLAKRLSAAKSVGGTYKAGRDGKKGVSGGRASKTISAVETVAEHGFEQVQIDIDAGLEHALEYLGGFQGSLDVFLQSLALLGDTSYADIELPEAQWSDLRALVAEVDGAMNSVSSANLLMLAVESGDGATMAAGTASRGLLETIEADPAVRGGLKMTRWEQRRIEVSRTGFTQGATHSLELFADTPQAQNALRDNGYFVIAPGGRALSVPQETLRVMATLVEPEQRLTQEIVVSFKSKERTMQRSAFERDPEGTLGEFRSWVDDELAPKEPMHSKL